jgi:rSAM/selenodomain-associated transferase 2
MTAQRTRRFSVALVVPVLNEATIVEATLRRLERDFAACELVVVDGGSTDGTGRLASAYARVIETEQGRAGQMNAGAAATTSDVIWFVHADTTIDSAALDQMRASLEDDSVVGGGLSLRFDRRSAGLDYLAWSSNLRARRLGWVFGDQAMFVRRATFEALGGFADLPLMEDLELSRRLKNVGNVVLLEATSTASARRIAQHGTWSMITFMQYLKALYLLGVDPEHIARRYQAGPPSLRNRRPPKENAACRPV